MSHPIYHPKSPFTPIVLHTFNYPRLCPHLITVIEFLYNLLISTFYQSRTRGSLGSSARRAVHPRMASRGACCAHRDRSLCRAVRRPPKLLSHASLVPTTYGSVGSCRNARDHASSRVVAVRRQTSKSPPQRLRGWLCSRRSKCTLLRTRTFAA